MNLSELLKTYEGGKRQIEKRSLMIRSQIDHRIEEETIKALKLQNHKVNQIHKNQQAIENKLKKQQELLGELRNNEQMWRSLYQKVNQSLKQAGDLVHYAGYVEAELAQILGEGSVEQYLQEAEKQQTKPVYTQETKIQEKIIYQPESKLEKSIQQEEQKVQAQKITQQIKTD